MKFIEDKLNEQGSVTYTMNVHNSETNAAYKYRAERILDVNADAAACTLAFTQDGTGDRVWNVRSKFSFREVEKLTVSSSAELETKRSVEFGYGQMTTEYVPPVFSLTVQMLKGKQVEGFPFFLDFRFREEDLAQRAAKAMVHAVELCGGGSKDPF